MKIRQVRVIKNWQYSKMLEITNEDFIYNTSGIKGRSYAKQDTTKYFKEAFKEFNLYPDMVEDRLGVMLLKHDQDGAYTQLHKDPAPIGYIHVRANVMLKKPPKGGDAVIDGQVFELEENDLWLIFPNIEEHGSTPIEGGERLIYSFGALINIQKITER
jgi:hypothetical protein